MSKIGGEEGWGGSRAGKMRLVSHFCKWKRRLTILATVLTIRAEFRGFASTLTITFLAKRWPNLASGTRKINVDMGQFWEVAEAKFDPQKLFSTFRTLKTVNFSRHMTKLPVSSPTLAEKCVAIFRPTNDRFHSGLDILGRVAL